MTSRRTVLKYGALGLGVAASGPILAGIPASAQGGYPLSAETNSEFHPIIDQSPELEASLGNRNRRKYYKVSATTPADQSGYFESRIESVRFSVWAPYTQFSVRARIQGADLLSEDSERLATMPIETHFIWGNEDWRIYPKDYYEEVAPTLHGRYLAIGDRPSLPGNFEVGRYRLVAGGGDLQSDFFQMRALYVSVQGGEEDLSAEYPQLVYCLDVYIHGTGWRRFFFDGTGDQGSQFYEVMNSIRYAYNEAQNVVEFRNAGWWSNTCRSLYSGCMHSNMDIHASHGQQMAAPARRHLAVNNAVGATLTGASDFGEWRVGRNAMTNLGNILSQRKNDGYDMTNDDWKRFNMDELQPVGDFLIEGMLNMNHVTLDTIDEHPTAGALEDAQNNQTRDAREDPDPGLG